MPGDPGRATSWRATGGLIALSAFHLADQKNRAEIADTSMKELKDALARMPRQLDDAQITFKGLRDSLINPLLAGYQTLATTWKDRKKERLRHGLARRRRPRARSPEVDARQWDSKPARRTRA